MLDNLQGLPTQMMPAVTDYSSGVRDRDKAVSSPLSQSPQIGSGLFSSKGDLDKTGSLPSINDQGKTVDFRKISDKLHSMLGEDDLSVEFSLDKESKRMILKVIDTKTKETIQQFPPEVTLKIARTVANILGNGKSGQVTNATA